MASPDRGAAAAMALLAVLAGGPLALAQPAAPAAPTPAVFALVVGVNRSVNPRQPLLRYADDDAARYLELFRALGAQVVLLSRLDEPTRRLHPQAAVEALLPNLASFQQSALSIAAQVKRARALGVRTRFYFVYAGHGELDGGEGTIALEDAHLGGGELARQLVERVGADEAHLIVDACYSFYLAQARGPGGQRRPLHGFSGLGALMSRRNVGLLLSTSSARESHEWEGYQGGIFSHQIRSGLHGAADADGDGRVTYREMAAFVRQASVAIANERFRPDLYARPPQGVDDLVDLRSARRGHIRVDGTRHGHYLLEDGRGLRLVEFHSAPGQAVTLIRPASQGTPLFMQEVGQGLEQPTREYPVPPLPAEVDLAALVPRTPPVRGRGAAHEAFRLLFTVPFDGKAVAGVQLDPLGEESGGADERAADEGRRSPPPAWRRPLLAATLGVAAASLVTAIGLHARAAVLASEPATALSGTEANRRNRQIEQYSRVLAPTFYGVAGGAALTSLAVWLFTRDTGQPASRASAIARRLELQLQPGVRQAGLAVRMGF